MLRKNWRDFEVTEIEADEMEVAYVVFEEDADFNKHYDLTKAVFSNLEVAKEYAAELNKGEEEANKNYVAIFKDYIAGSYDYL